MKWIMIFGVGLLYVWSLLSPASTQTDMTSCDLFYILQPVEHYTCNPYSETYGMRLECLIYYVTSQMPSNLSIYWYRVLEGASNEDQPELVNQFETQRSVFGVDQNLLRARFRISSIGEQHAGTYWCQVVRLREEDNSVIELGFEPSQKIRLRHPSNYTNFPPCSNDYLSTQVSTCAINGVNIEPPMDQADNSFPPNVTTDAITESDLNPEPSIHTTASNNVIRSTTVHVTTDSSKTSDPEGIEDDGFLPLWGYAVIAGGGLAVLITGVCLLCILLLICLWLRDRKKYVSRSASSRHFRPTDHDVATSSTHQPNKLHTSPLPHHVLTDQPSKHINEHEISPEQEKSVSQRITTRDPIPSDIEAETTFQANDTIPRSTINTTSCPESPAVPPTTTTLNTCTDEPGDSEHHDTNPGKNDATSTPLETTDEIAAISEESGKPLNSPPLLPEPLPDVSDINSNADVDIDDDSVAVTHNESYQPETAAGLSFANAPSTSPVTDHELTCANEDGENDNVNMNTNGQLQTDIQHQSEMGNEREEELKTDKK